MWFQVLELSDLPNMVELGADTFYGLAGLTKLTMVSNDTYCQLDRHGCWWHGHVPTMCCMCCMC